MTFSHILILVEAKEHPAVPFEQLDVPSNNWQVEASFLFQYNVVLLNSLVLQNLQTSSFCEFSPPHLLKLISSISLVLFSTSQSTSDGDASSYAASWVWGIISLSLHHQDSLLKHLYSHFLLTLQGSAKRSSSPWWISWNPHLGMYISPFIPGMRYSINGCSLIYSTLCLLE